MRSLFRREKLNHHFPELKRQFSQFRAINWISRQHLAVGVIVLALCCGMAYLLQTNITATQGYQIKDLEQQLADAKENHDQLQLKYIELQSMTKVAERATDLDLVVATDVAVISSINSVVAKR